MKIFFWLIVAHCITDVFLQNKEMSTSKKPKDGTHWVYWMFAHSVMNGLGVYVVTGSILLTILETIFHFLIDTGKSTGLYNVHVDQALHLNGKAIIALLCLFL